MTEKIMTVSLNPAMNVILWMDTLSSEQTNHVKMEKIEPSGGALNIARVLSGLHVEHLSLGVYGEDNQLQFERLLNHYGIHHNFISRKGETKQDITMILPKNTVIKTARNGVAISIPQLRELQQKISSCLAQGEDKFVVFSGEQPQGMDGSELLQFIDNACRKNAKIVLNTPGLSVPELRTLRPFLTMMDLSQLKAITKINFRNETTILRCIQSMTDDLEHIVVNLGARGFLYSSKEQNYRIVMPQNKVIHPEGSDHFLAGLLCGIVEGKPMAEALTLAGKCAAWCIAGGEKDFSRQQAEECPIKIVLEQM